jgi:hypothetical protein
MTCKDQGIGGSVPRWLQASRRGRQAGGIAIAVAGAGLMATLTGCGPLSVAAATSQPHGGNSPTSGVQTATLGGHQTTSSSPSTKSSMTSTGNGAYSFTTLDNPADHTFNQLPGFNNHGIIAGYFGSGAMGTPNKGYVLVRTRAGFRIMNENFPGSAQTQVTGLNDLGVTVGFWSDMNNANQQNDNFGFYWLNGRFHNVNFPTRNNATPPVNQLLGVNDQDVAVGFYNDAKGNAHGYTYGIRGGWFRSVTIKGASSVTAAAINNNDDVAGFFTNAKGTTDAFLRTTEGRTYTLAYPGASMTQALGVNDFNEVVGVYTVGSGNSAVTHGFTWTPGREFKSVDDPQGVGSTTINGVNDSGDIVGFYTDSAGNTDGFAAVPAGQRPLPGLIGATTTPSASPSTTAPSTSPSTSMPSAPSTSPATSMPTSTSPASTSPTSPNNPQPTHW